MIVEQAGIETVRPGRELFVRRLRLGEANRPEIQVVFLHGTCATEKQFHLLLDAMERQMTAKSLSFCLKCLLYDWVGCGQSPVIRDWDAYDNKEGIADLAALMDRHVDRSRPVVIVGHSYGPSIFLRYLEKQPLVNLSGTILMSTAVRSDKLSLANGGHPVMKLPLVILKCLQSTMTNAFVQMAVHPSHEKLRRAIKQDSNRNDMFCAKSYHQHMMFAPEASLQHIQEKPALIIHGADDGIISVDCAQHLANHLPKSKLIVIEQASHLVMIEQPDQVASEVLAFLETIH